MAKTDVYIATSASFALGLATSYKLTTGPIRRIAANNKSGMATVHTMWELLYSVVSSSTSLVARSAGSSRNLLTLPEISDFR